MPQVLETVNVGNPDERLSWFLMGRDHYARIRRYMSWKPVAGCFGAPF